MRAFLLLLCICLSSLSWTLAGIISKDENAATVSKLTLEPVGGAIDTDDDDEIELESSSLVEENPDFVPPEDDDDDDDDDDSDNDESDDDDETDKKDAKSKLSKKLKKKGRFAVLKKNRMKITLALAVFAFRRELWMLFWKVLGMSFSENGPTNILKLLLFVDFMRRMQSGGTAEPGGPSLVKTVGGLLKDNPAYLPPIQQHFCFESLNEYYVKDGMALQKAIRNKHEGLKWPSSSSLSRTFRKGAGKATTTTTNTTADNGRTVVVLDWTKLDEQITSQTQLRQEVNFLLSEYRTLVMEGEASETTNSPPPLEVVLLLESPGGSVPDYGLAGQHLLRLRNEHGVTLTICVDKVAASGGYMLCCTASPGKLYAAPFAYLGSIGVIATQVNVRKLLTNWGIQPLEYRGGKYKAPIGLLGKITKNGKKVTQTMVDDIHEAFKEHVVQSRPILKEKIDEIGNGSVWLGTSALDLGLIDELKTSDQYIAELIQDGSRVFKMLQAPRTGFLFGPRLGHYSAIESKDSTASIEAKESSSPTIENLESKATSMLLRLPAQAKSLVSKSLRSFQ